MVSLPPPATGWAGATCTWWFRAPGMQGGVCLRPHRENGRATPACVIQGEQVGCPVNRGWRLSKATRVHDLILRYAHAGQFPTKFMTL